MPSGSVTWLGANPGDLQYGNLLMGSGTPWYLAADPGLTGWEDSPLIDTGTIHRAQQHGAWPGRHLAQTRIITAELVVRAPAGQSLAQVVRQLAAATQTDMTTEIPLIIQIDETPMVCWARCIRRSLPVASSWRLGVARASIQWEASDPRRYQIAEQIAVTGLPQPESGLSWGSPETGLAWGSPTETGLQWGTPGPTGDITCTNSGDTATYPVIEIRGPVTNPSVTLPGSGVVLEYGVTLAAGDVLIVDTLAGTVLLGGQSRLGTATLRSQPEGSFVLPPGISTVSFRSTDIVAPTTASATIRWRSAYW